MYKISVKNVSDNDHWIYLTDHSVVAGSYKHGNESRGFSKANRLAERLPVSDKTPLQRIPLLVSS
jgi:hypothetical protein